MRQICLTGSWLIRAQREDVYAIVSDFENMPAHFPQVAKSMRVVERSGNDLTIHARAASFGSIFPEFSVVMTTMLLPSKGFISDNVNDTLGIFGHEELLLSDVHEGTRIDYSYVVTIRSAWLRVLARPLIGWLGMWFWKRAFIDRLKEMLEAPQGAVA
jgi:hypothetical protein